MKIIKILCTILAVMLCFAVFGCSQQGTSDSSPDSADYDIIEKGGYHYIVFDDIQLYKSNSQTLADVSFPSIEAFRQAVTKGALTDEQKRIIATAFPQEDGAILSCDFDSMHEPIVPENCSVGDVIWGGGPSYSFELTSSNTIFGWFHYLSESDYVERYQQDYETLFARDTVIVTKTEDLGNEMTATYYSTRAGELKNLRYSLGSGSIKVDKTYRLHMNNSTVETSSTIPSEVILYCSSGDQRYIIALYGFSNEPSDDWLLSFGLTKFAASSDVRE